jgi:hypothetical protein
MFNLISIGKGLRFIATLFYVLCEINIRIVCLYFFEEEKLKISDRKYLLLNILFFI